MGAGEVSTDLLPNALLRPGELEGQRAQHRSETALRGIHPGVLWFSGAMVIVAACSSSYWYLIR